MAEQIRMLMGTNAERRKGIKIFSPVSPCMMASLTKEGLGQAESFLWGNGGWDGGKGRKREASQPRVLTFLGSPEVLLRKVTLSGLVLAEHSEGPVQLFFPHQQHSARRAVFQGPPELVLGFFINWGWEEGRESADLTSVTSTKCRQRP